ncbi:hypothetical protein I302_102708 [Kwoniella bestiolae CBS 10118]|uniref:Uncharacterized protein n=1 Tax=Kwoniella bestiolae CBS 10118 TaxID=1296100 RepID=A0A1B9GFV2_9TREE|nr:hypothetical protein I302_01401 [Kwoniella bestiolae CBS 10118]OCF29888.1 hypothetical protein I302_01401 [Kwoniella bestiolae CBS 10118]
MSNAQASISQETAQSLTAQAGGLQNASEAIQRLRDRAEAAGLDPEEHVNTTNGFIAVSSQLGEVLQAQISQQHQQQPPNSD